MYFQSGTTGNSTAILQRTYHLLTGNPTRALAHAETAVKLSRESGYVLTTLVCQIQLAFVMHHQGRTEAALETINGIWKQSLDIRSRIYEFMCLMVRAKIVLDQDPCRGLEYLREALILGRQQDYLNMIWWWQPAMFSQLCEQALPAGIETDYVKKLIRVHKLVPSSTAGHIENWPWAVKVYAFNRFQIWVNGEPVRFSGKIPKKPLELLQGGRGRANRLRITAEWKARCLCLRPGKRRSPETPIWRHNLLLF